MTVAEVLRSAAERLRTHGWCQGDYAQDQNGNGVSTGDPRACRFCLVGAMMGPAREGRNLHAAKEAVNRVIAGQWANVYHFNDTYGRTVDEVIAVLEAAAAAEEARS